MKSRSMQSGYILVVTLIVLSLIMLIVAKLSQQSFVQRGYDATQIERMQAQELAFSGIQCAMSQLAFEAASPEKKETDPKLAFLKRMLPLFFTEQTFDLKESVDALDGHIGIRIIPEEGKFPINRWYDFSKKQFIDDATKKMAKKLFDQLAQKNKEGSVFEDVEHFLKNRGRKLDDPTELLEILVIAKIFDVPNRFADIADFFTVDTSAAWPNSWVLSESVRKFFGFKKIDRQERAAVKELTAGIKALPPDLKTLWSTYLIKLYGKELAAVPQELQTAFNSTLFFKNFTVISYGKVGQTHVYLTALLERVDDASFIIKRLYWN